MCAADGAYGEGMTQTDMMEKDMLILVDGDDRITGAMSKREAHEFSAATPRGIPYPAPSPPEWRTAEKNLCTPAQSSGAARTAPAPADRAATTASGPGSISPHSVGQAPV